ncbi:hypothetical protein AGMMS49975_09070 [Clostridia bacterium]|nr:hypothetical protein AGMMS49975_09070 [Clostridia bacterium]
MAKTVSRTKTPARGKKAMNADEYKASIAAFEKRRKKRLDEAEEEAKVEEAAMENANSDEDENTDEESAVVEEINENSDTPTLEDKINLIKDRRDRRDADGDTEDPETAKGIIAHQDEDIETLLEIVEELQAKNDFAQQDEGDDEPDKKDCDVLTEGGGGGPEIIIKTDSREAIKREIKERVNLGLVGRTLKLDGLEDKTPLEAKKAIIKKLRPRLNLDGKGAMYIDVAYEQSIEEMKTPKDTNYQRGQVFNADSRGRQSSGASKSQKARENMLKRMQNGGNE